MDARRAIERAVGWGLWGCACLLARPLHWIVRAAHRLAPRKRLRLAGFRLAVRRRRVAPAA